MQIIGLRQYSAGMFWKRRSHKPHAHSASALQDAPDYMLSTTVRPDTVVEAQSSYSRALLRTMRTGVLIAVVLVLGQILFAAISRLDHTPSAVTVSPWALDAGTAGAALLILFPASIALQVLLRATATPRIGDAENLIAQRQFWGDVSSMVAGASAFVGLSAFVNAVASEIASRQLDVVTVFGVPLGALLTMVFSSDAATIAALEARELGLRPSRDNQTITKLSEAIDSVRGTGAARPRRALAARCFVLGVVAVGMCTAAVGFLFGNFEAAHPFSVGSAATFGYAATVLTLISAFAAISAAPSMLRGDVLGVILLMAMAALGAIVMTLAEILAIFPYAEQRWDDLGRAIAVGIGVTSNVPAAAVLVSICVRRRSSRRTAPLLDYARFELKKQVDRLQQRPSSDDKTTEPWMTFAWSAIVLGVLPPAGFACAAIATRSRASRNQGGRLLAGAWIVPSTFAIAELLAILLIE